MTSRWRKAIACAILLVVTLSVGCATMGLVETIESLLKQIKELLTAQKWDAALTKVAEVIRREPTEWRAYLFGAQAYIGKADWGQALTQARKAVELAPRESETLTTLAQSLFGAGTDALQRRAFGEAVSHFVEYIAGRVLVDGVSRAGDSATRGQLVQGLLDGGRQALSRGEYQGAAGLLREYVRQEPGDVSALLDLGKAYWSSNDRTEALAAFRRVLELAPQNEEARRFLLGR